VIRICTSLSLAGCMRAMEFHLGCHMPNAVCRSTRVTCSVRKGELLLSNLFFVFSLGRTQKIFKVGLKRCRVELWVGSKQETAKEPSQWLHVLSLPACVVLLPSAATFPLTGAFCNLILTSTRAVAAFLCGRVEMEAVCTSTRCFWYA